MLPYQHIIIIEKESKVPVYKQIAISIINAIRNGTLKAGTHLLSSRELARMLQVHRKTVVSAYDELQAQEWITVYPRKYVIVAENLPVLKPKKWNEPTEKSSYEQDFNIPFRVVRDVMKTDNSVPEIIVDDGHPDVRLSPINDLLKTLTI